MEQPGFFPNIALVYLTENLTIIKIMNNFQLNQNIGRLLLEAIICTKNNQKTGIIPLAIKNERCPLRRA